mmetsp:Transcript_12913/g.27899  ORF Transcript_12913/g.27899 Transcript_12913/m.27899 type:complete len:163 (-) Transcript_12913:937-1425(-)
MPKLKPLDVKIDPIRCMGDWYVQRQIPAVSAFEKDVHNGKESYTWDELKEKVTVKYTFNRGSHDAPVTTVYQKGWVKSNAGTEWRVAPWLGFFYLPFSLPYYIIDIDTNDYSYMTAAGPSIKGNWLYVMTREKVVEESKIQKMLEVVEKNGFDLSQNCYEGS